MVRQQQTFQSRRTNRGERIAKAAQEVAGWLAEFSEQYLAVRSALEAAGNGGRFGEAVADVRQQIDWLMCDSILSVTPWRWLKNYPRYLRGIEYRLEKLRSGAGDRDAESMQSIGQLWDRWLAGQLEATRNPVAQAESEFRWMIEELRVSLFAQPLGTSIKVSVKRCEKLLT